jgi:DNA mismatch endonuclease (patch repair protein)
MLVSTKRSFANSSRSIDPPVSLRKSREMSRVPGKNTAPEVLVRSALHAAGLRFRLHDRGLPGSPDIVLPRWRTVVLVHGCFWHRHKDCPRASLPKTRRDFWAKKLRGNVRRDRANRTALEAMGWRVIEIWECDVRGQHFSAGLLKAFKRPSSLRRKN